MASNRYINTNFWKDNYIADLDPVEKLLFNYFLTNSRTNIAGAYEINLREVAFDTGIDKDMVQKILTRFQNDGKMFYQDGYIVIRNWVKHQKINPSVRKGIDRYLNLLPDSLKQYVLTDDNGNSVGIAYDSLSTGSPQAATNINYKQETINNELQTINYKPGLELELAEDPNATTAGQGTLQPDQKATTKQIDGMFDYWLNEVGYSITSKKKQNREYAGKLLHEYPKQEIAMMIKGAALASEDQYAPGVSDFVDLYRKWDKLKLWGKKKGVSQRATAVF